MLLGEDACYAEFLALMPQHPQQAVALWAFSLAQVGILPTETDEIRVRPQVVTGDPFVDGGGHKGIFVLESPMWSTAMVAKIARDAGEVSDIVAKISLPPLRAGVGERRGPHFAVPVAIAVFGEASGGEEGFSDGIVLMHQVGGRPSQRFVSFSDARFAESLVGARLEGEALALFQTPHLRPKAKGSVLEQTIWCHADLHHGNVVVDHLRGRVSYLDFDKMQPCENWFAWEVTEQAAPPVARDPAVYELAGRAATTGGHCLADAARWLGDPAVEQELARLDPVWLASQLRFQAFAGAYLEATVDFAQEPIAAAFDDLCRRGLRWR